MQQLFTVVLCLTVIAVGCGSERGRGQDQRQAARDAPDTERLTACLRDSGATVKVVVPPRRPGFEDQRVQAHFGSALPAGF